MTAVAELFTYEVELDLLRSGRKFYWSIERYQAAILNGTLGEEDRVELFFGTSISKISIHSPHAACVSKTKRYFSRRFPNYEIRTENSVVLLNDSMPEPDCIIAEFRDDFYLTNHPGPNDVKVVIEVADSTVKMDRTSKQAAYALAGIVEYWIVNVKEQQVEVYLSPDRMSGVYKQFTHYSPSETFSSPFAGQVAVLDLLPTTAG